MPTSSSSNQSLLAQLSVSNHKKILFCNDKVSGLQAIIAIHDTTLGPALGGVRMWNYESESEAVADVLRLSQAMTYKAAVAGLNLGGAAAVIIGDSRTQKSELLLRSFGHYIQNLNGEFIAGEDVGTNAKDMEYIGMETKHVTGLPASLGGLGNPAPYSAKGVYFGIKAALKEKFGTDELAGRTVVVQGLGKVGETLVKLLRSDNADVFVTDIDTELMHFVASKYKAKAIEADKLFTLAVDVYAPCALGATLNDKTIRSMKFAIIAGSANNQLADEKKHGLQLHEKGIIYAPDYLINAGGIISCYSELAGLNKKHTEQLTENIYDATREVIQRSRNKNIATSQAAAEIAEKRITAIKHLKSIK